MKFKCQMCTGEDRGGDTPEQFSQHMSLVHGVKTTPDEVLTVHYNNPEVQRHLEEIETDDAVKLLEQLGIKTVTSKELTTAKLWLKKHWNDGWTAAGRKPRRHAK